MTKAGHLRRVVAKLLLFFGVSLALVGISGCGGIIQIVPVSQLTPVAREELPGSPIAATLASAPDRIVAKTIGLDSPVVEMGWRVVERWGERVSEWEMPETGAAWHRNSAYPGQGSNIVISGHNASTGGQVFAEIEALQVGDEITLWTANQEPFNYQVTEKTIVRTFASSDEADNYLQTITDPTSQEQLTLITCWPRWTNTHRLIVIAEPV
jgi:sortase A